MYKENDHFFNICIRMYSALDFVFFSHVDFISIDVYFISSIILTTTWSNTLYWSLSNEKSRYMVDRVL